MPLIPARPADPRLAARTTRALASTTLAAGLAAIAAPAAAHPHAWIDLLTRIHIDEHARIERIEQVWQVDPSYSIVLLEEELERGGERPLDVALRDMAEDLHERLVDADYLMRLDLRSAAAGESATDGSADHRLTLAERGVFAPAIIEWHAPHLVILTTWTAHEPIPADGALLRSFDPVYWMEMLHIEAPEIVDASSRCTIDVVPPRPDPALIRYAASLDRENRDPIWRDGNPLGLLFAERVELHCSPS